MIGLISPKTGSNMGYYTSYGLSITPDEGYEDDVQKFENALRDECRYSDGKPDEEIEDLLAYGSVWAKLYDLESTIDDLAPKFPHLLISLEGDGEESGDSWEKRWKGEYSEKLYTIIPPFRKELMTEEEKKQDNNN